MPTNNREYQRAYIRKHYHANKAYYRQKAKDRDAIVRPKLRAFTDRYKMWKGCVDCGYKAHPQALHFDHLRDKVRDIATMVQRCVSMKKLKDEIRKCEVRCANCHAVITTERRALSC